MSRVTAVCTAGLACLTLLVSTAPSRALMVAPAPLPQRVASAELIVVGKLGKVEDKNISATAAPGAKDKVEYQVLTLEVEKVLLGKADKTIRLAFIPPQNPAPIPTPDGGLVISPRLPYRGLVFTSGQEGIFFLTRHHEEKFFVAPMFFDFIDKKNTTFDSDLETIQRCARLLEDPNKSLKAKSEEDRLFTVSMLLTRYNTPRSAKAKRVPIDAEQSRLILQALAEADWTPPKPRPNVPIFNQVTAQQLFYQLQAQAKDGWMPPKDVRQFPAAAKEWLKANTDTFRVQRYVTEESEK